MKVIVFLLMFYFILMFPWKQVIAQANFQNGFVLSQNGDTIKGVIDVNSLSQNSEMITFKDAVSSMEYLFTPMDIYAFGIGNDTYYSAIVQIEEDVTSGNTLSNVPFMQLKIDTLFLKTVIPGTKSLYICRNKAGKDFFYIFYEGGYELLTYKKYLKESGNSPVILENNSYRNLLLAYLSDCPVIHRKMTGITYTLESLKRLFESYYHCNDTKAEFEGKQMKVRKHHGILFGPVVSHVSFSGEDYPELVKTDFGHSLNFTLGYYRNFHLTGNMTPWSVDNDILINWYNSTKDYLEYETEHDYAVTTFNILFTYIKLYNQFSYNFPYHQLNINVSAGMSNGLTGIYRNERRKQSFFYSMVRTVETTAVPRIRRHEFGWVASIGASYRNLGFQFRFEQGNGMSGIEELRASTLRYHFIIGLSI